MESQKVRDAEAIPPLAHMRQPALHHVSREPETAKVDQASAGRRQVSPRADNRARHVPSPKFAKNQIAIWGRYPSLQSVFFASMAAASPPHGRQSNPARIISLTS